MTDPLIQSVLKEVLRQSGQGEQKSKEPAKSNNLNKDAANSSRQAVTNQLISSILYKKDSPQKSQHKIQQQPQQRCEGSNTSGKDYLKKPEFKHTQIKNREELVGFATGGTVGFVIPNLDFEIRNKMNLSNEYRSIGIISSRVGAAAQIMAVDEAVKKTNSTVVSIQLARDSQGGPGHGVYILMGSVDVADVTRAVEIALEAVDDSFEQVYNKPAGTVEVHYTARAAEALNTAFKAPLNNAFGIIVGAPAGIGLIMSDIAVKTATVDVTYYSGPSVDSAFTNEVWLAFTGDSAAVKNALEAAKSVGLQLLDSYR